MKVLILDGIARDYTQKETEYMKGWSRLKEGNIHIVDRYKAGDHVVTLDQIWLSTEKGTWQPYCTGRNLTGR